MPVSMLLEKVLLYSARQSHRYQETPSHEVSKEYLCVL